MNFEMHAGGLFGIDVLLVNGITGCQVKNRCMLCKH